MSKVVLSLCLAVLIVVSLAGCGGGAQGGSTGSSEKPAASEPAKSADNASGTEKAPASEKAEAKKITVGVTIQGNKSTFMQYVVAGMKDYVKDMKDVELLVVYAEDKAEKQVGQVDNFIAQKVDAIIVNPIDKEASAPAIDAAVKANIPVITVNTQTTNQSKATAFSGCDDVQSGEIQMQYIADLLGGKGNVCFIHGAMGHPAQIGRREGYMNILKKYPDMKLVFEQTADWQADKAMVLVENWLQTGKQIDAIACNCDTEAIGAENAIDAAKKTGKIIVMGMDAIPDVMKSIKDGVIAGTIWQDGIGQGKNAVDLAIRAAKGEKVQSIFIPYELVNRKNIDDYYKKADERDAITKKYF